MEGTGAVGGRSSVVRVLAAQARDRGSIPSGLIPGSFPHSLFCLCIMSL